MSQSSVQIVSPIERGGHADVGAALGRAFEDDPLWAATFGEGRLPKLVSMFTALSRTTLAAGGIVEVTPGVSGAAVWMSPGKKEGLWSMLRTGLHFLASHLAFQRESAS